MIWGDTIARQATQEVLQDAIEADPSLKDLSEEELAKKAGRIFPSAERPDFKVYGFIMLLWFGGEEGRSIAAKGAVELATEPRTMNSRPIDRVLGAPR